MDFFEPPSRRKARRARAQQGRRSDCTGEQNGNLSSLEAGKVDRRLSVVIIVMKQKTGGLGDYLTVLLFSLELRVTT